MYMRHIEVHRRYIEDIYIIGIGVERGRYGRTLYRSSTLLLPLIPHFSVTLSMTVSFHSTLYCSPSRSHSICDSGLRTL